MRKPAGFARQILRLNRALTIIRPYRAMDVDSIRGVVETAIQRASDATGVDFSFLLGTRRESGYNPGAHAPTSSAAGLFQFVEQTWLATLKQHGSKYGYARYADLISKARTAATTSRAEARQVVMDLRFDPHAASLMAGELASDHASYLRGRMGRDPTAGELYAATSSAAGFGQADRGDAIQPDRPAAALFRTRRRPTARSSTATGVRPASARSTPT